MLCFEFLGPTRATPLTVSNQDPRHPGFKIGLRHLAFKAKKARSLSWFVSFCYGGTIGDKLWWRYLNVDKTRDAGRSRSRLNTSGCCCCCGNWESSHGAVDERKRRGGRPNQHHCLLLFCNDAQETDLILMLWYTRYPLDHSLALCLGLGLSLPNSIALCRLLLVAVLQALHPVEAQQRLLFYHQCCYQFGICRYCSWCRCCLLVMMKLKRPMWCTSYITTMYAVFCLPERGHRRMSMWLVNCRHVIQSVSGIHNNASIWSLFFNNLITDLKLCCW